MLSTRRRPYWLWQHHRLVICSSNRQPHPHHHILPWSPLRCSSQTWVACSCGASGTDPPAPPHPRPSRSLPCGSERSHQDSGWGQTATENTTNIRAAQYLVGILITNLFARKEIIGMFYNNHSLPDSGRCCSTFSAYHESSLLPRAQTGLPVSRGTLEHKYSKYINWSVQEKIEKSN